MNPELVASLVRSVLKVFGAALVTRGITDNATLEIAIGGLAATIGIVWSWIRHKEPPAQ